MNRLTDALYMVRFKVRPGSMPLTQSSLVGGRKRLRDGVDTCALPFWQQTLTEMKGAGQHLHLTPLHQGQWPPGVPSRQTW